MTISADTVNKITDIIAEAYIKEKGWENWISLTAEEQREIILNIMDNIHARM